MMSEFIVFMKSKQNPVMKMEFLSYLMRNVMEFGNICMNESIVGLHTYALVCVNITALLCECESACCVCQFAVIHALKHM